MRVRALAVVLLLVLAGGAGGISAAPIAVTVEGEGRLVVVGDAGPRPIAVGGRPHNLAVTPDGRVWMTDEAAPRVWVVDPSTYVIGEATEELIEGDVVSGRILSRTPVGRRPHGVVVLPR